MSDSNFPRLLYWADLPVDPSSAGAILMHRLLEGWPADRLMIVTPRPVDVELLPGSIKLQSPRDSLDFLYRTRFAFEAMTLQTLWKMALRKLRNGGPPPWLAPAVKDFAPEAILTVGIAGAWMGADALARRLKIPLHVIVHDDHHYAFFWVDRLKPWGERLFGAAYRRAVSRLCVSEPMERMYRERFGVKGDVLLPVRGRDSIFFRTPRPPSDKPLQSAKVFCFGSIYGNSFARLNEIGAALAARGHRLIVYTLSQPAPGFRAQNIELRPPQPSITELVKSVHNEADVLLLLTDFSQRESLRTLFPSKMVDYTAAAVPILVVAPEDASIAQYLKKWPLAGQLLCDDSPAAIADAVDALARDPGARQTLAAGAVSAGEQNFSYEKAFEMFCSVIRRRTPV
jgi:glycosyltransferase involved in cell wall biosynthesis